MAIPPKLLFLSLLLILTITTTTTSTNSDLLIELQSIQSRSPTGVIHLTDSLLRRIITTKSRTFNLITFFDAIQLHDKSELHLKSLKAEFHLTSKSFITNNVDSHKTLSKLFFCDIEFGESQASFAQFGVNALPHIRLVPSGATDLKRDSVSMDAGDFSRLAESMAEFIEGKIEVKIGEIHRPPIVSKTQFGFIIAVLIVSLPFLVKRVFAGETLLHDKRVWLSGSVFVYFFSVSGSGMQLGAEGFAIGFLYTVVGLLLAFVTHILVRVKSSTVQRVFMIIAMVVSVWAVRKVVWLDNWKTGYAVHAYLPSSW
nr:probable dolichyl-diphosphooligosaccharide--protein glycosyltransferase subunit 3B [Tanacetum cinerariifolium]